MKRDDLTERITLGLILSRAGDVAVALVLLAGGVGLLYAAVWLLTLLGSCS